MPRTAGQGSSAFGALLQRWRKIRQMSQLDLAVEASASPRHVSFVETGRAKPSREMVLVLANALNVPLREQNALLLAAGFAPMYRETTLQAGEFSAVRAALDAMLLKQEPYPAVVMNRYWDIEQGNRAADKFFGFLLGNAPRPGPANVVRLMFDPQGLKPFVANWERVAEMLIRRMHREAVGGVLDDTLNGLIEEVLQMPGVPEHLLRPALEAPQEPVIPVTFRKAGRTFNFFSAITTIGTPQDITLQEIRIESFFPLDAETERLAAQMLV